MAKPRQAVPSCKELRKGAYYTLGNAGPSAKKLADAGSDEVELPFAVELGGAVPYAKGYAVAALTGSSEGSMASVAIVSGDAQSGRLLELGAVHGDVVPPRLATHADELIAAVVDNDAGSQTLRLLSLAPSGPEPVIGRGPAIDQGRDDSSAFDLCFAGTHGLLVWDRYDKPRGHVVVEASSFSVKEIANPSEPSIVSQEQDDAEMPRIVPRPGGFWMTYVAHGAPEHVEPEQADADVDSVVDLTPRRLTILPLDEAGAPTGKPQQLTSEGSHVLAYDLASNGAGALVAWRDDPTTLGVEAPVVYVAEVRPDGSFQIERVENQEFGAGAPILLVEDAPSKMHPWLGVMGSDQVLWLAGVAPGPKLSPPAPLPDPLRLAEPMLRQMGNLLLARPRGRVVDLSVVRCEER